MTDRKAPPDAPSDLLVEKLALGELDEAEAASVRDALGDAADAKLAALAADDDAILQAHPPAKVAAEVARRVRRAEAAPAEPSRSSVSWWIPATALAAATAFGWLWLRPASGPTERGDVIAQSDVVEPGADTGEQVFVKGDPRLWIERQVDGRPQRLTDGATVATGTRLQLHYDAAGRTEGVIVSIDGRGVATLHLPADAGAPPTLRTGGPVALDHAYELDDAPAFERFFFVTADADHEVDVEAVMDAARALATRDDATTEPLALPAGLQQRSILLRKR